MKRSVEVINYTEFNWGEGNIKVDHDKLEPFTKRNACMHVKPEDLHSILLEAPTGRT
jgi:hypothetical protein